MQVLAIFPNRDERTLVRAQLAKFGSAAALANLREAKDELPKIKKLDCLIIDDSAGDRMLRRRWSDEIEKDISTGEFLEIVNEHHQPLIMVCCGEQTSTDDLLYYNELGVDMILRRPYTAKELGDKIEEAYQSILSPPPTLVMWQKLRALARSGNAEAARAIEPLYQKTPDDVRLGNLFASLLLKGATKESYSKAKAVLDSLEAKLPNSISVKSKQFELYKALNDSETALDKACDLLTLTPSNLVLEGSLALARDMKEKHGARGFIKLMKCLAGLPLTKKTLQAIQGVSEELTSQITDSDQLFQFIEAVEKTGGEATVVQYLTKAVERVKEIDDFTYAKLAQMVQKANPGEGTTIERYLHILTEQKSFAVAEQLVTQIKNAKNFSTNFFAAATRLALEQGLLKEASDMLHLGRKSRPSDDRWDALAKDWKQRFEALNSVSDPSKPK